MTEIKSETQQFDRRYRELDASGAAVLRTIIELAVLLLKPQAAPTPEPQKEETT